MSEQNGQYFERSLDPYECDVRRVERHKNIPSTGAGGGGRF